MRDELLPLFPLAVVLLPHNELPLHIFEDRYKEMIGQVLDQHSEFGVVLAAEGGISPVGCTARVDRVLRRYDDGRMDLIAVGHRRFVVSSLNQERDYLRAEVEFFDDEDTSEAPQDLRQRAVRSSASLDEAGEPAEVDVDSSELSFLLARRAEDIGFRHQLLQMRSERERLEKFVGWAGKEAIRLREERRMKAIAPKNGHGKHPPDLEG